MDHDVAFYRLRASQEQEAARNSAHPSARLTHLTLAARYDDLANTMEARDRHFDFRRIAAVFKTVRLKFGR